VSKQLLFGWMWRATTARTTCAVGINDRVPRIHRPTTAYVSDQRPAKRAVPVVEYDHHSRAGFGVQSSASSRTVQT
jgi:hypothetical protein